MDDMLDLMVHLFKIKDLWIVIEGNIKSAMRACTTPTEPDLGWKKSYTKNQDTKEQVYTSTQSSFGPP